VGLDGGGYSLPKLVSERVIRAKYRGKNENGPEMPADASWWAEKPNNDAGFLEKRGAKNYQAQQSEKQALRGK
jgi:hypothetical protein